MTNRRLAMERLLHVDTVDAGAKAEARKPRTAGAVRAMGLTLAQSEASADGRNVQEIEPSLCDPSFARDRLGEGGAYQSEDDGIEAFAESIADGGQVVPILVRPHPDAKGRYQIAYGHRRVRACARLGQPVRAIVAALSDDDLIVAQGRGKQRAARSHLHRTSALCANAGSASDFACHDRQGARCRQDGACPAPRGRIRLARWTRGTFRESASDRSPPLAQARRLVPRS